MFLFNRRRQRRKADKNETCTLQAGNPHTVSGSEMGNECVHILSLETGTKNSFTLHMSKNIGETVIVFVKCGGAAGAGFTGILTEVTDIYVKLITRPGPAPSIFYNNIYPGILSAYSRNPCFLACKHIMMVKGLGSITYIPINKITAFVHNLVI